MVTWVDVVPTILDYCRVTPKPSPAVRPGENEGHRQTEGRPQPYKFHGKSSLAVLDKEHPDGWDQMFASHTFHEITNYYPMRVHRDGNYKYIYNIAHQLPYPFASDLYASPTWQGVLQRNDNSELYGQRTVYSYLQRPQHELYDLAADPHETKNLAYDPQHRETLERMQEQVKAWQKATKDPWFHKWEYE
jgi:N-sulfoglucosamine sulfohydrolase